MHTVTVITHGDVAAFLVEGLTRNGQEMLVPYIMREGEYGFCVGPEDNWPTRELLRVIIRSAKEVEGIDEEWVYRAVGSI